MGACGSKKATTKAVLQQKKPDPDDDKSDDGMMDGLANSFHDPSRSSREKMVWHREGIHLEELYETVKLIGQGSMGEVLSVRKKNKNLPNAATAGMRSERLYAAKTINTTRFKKSEIKEFINEIDILRDLDHPNIIHLFEICSTKRKIWIITELCTGGDLGERARSTPTGMTEYEVADVMEQILRALAYLHSRGVCHRDLKFENIMYVDGSCGSALKLIDFGLSNKFKRGEKMEEVCGTLYTLAPEMLSTEGYTEQADLWSVGCLAFILQSNQYPFLQEAHELEDKKKRAALENAQYEFGLGWRQKNISEMGKNFVRNCLKKDPNERWTAVKALEYVQREWLPYLDQMEEQLESLASNGNNGRNKELRTQVSARSKQRMESKMLEGMHKYAVSGEFKKRVLVTMAYTMDKTSVRELREIFLSLDTNNSGTITLGELKEALTQMNSDKHMDDATIEKLFKGIDIDKSGNIHYAEFIAAVIESQGLISMERLADTFDRLDSEGKGYISKDNLRQLLGKDYNAELVDQMIEEADFKKNGQVDYEEFLRLMFGHDPAAGFQNIGSSMNLNIDQGMVEQLAAVGVQKEFAEQLFAAARASESALSSLPEVKESTGDKNEHSQIASNPLTNTKAEDTLEVTRTESSMAESHIMNLNIDQGMVEQLAAVGVQKEFAEQLFDAARASESALYSLPELKESTGDKNEHSQIASNPLTNTKAEDTLEVTRTESSMAESHIDSSPFIM